MSDSQGLGYVAGVATKNYLLLWRSHLITNCQGAAAVAASVQAETISTRRQLRMREMKLRLCKLVHEITIYQLHGRSRKSALEINTWLER